MEEIEYAIWLSIVNLTPIKKYQLFLRFGSFKAIYEAKKEDFLEIEDFNFIDIHELDTMKNRENILKYLNYIHQNGIQIITINSEKYPSKLKNIFDPPLVLYAKGNIDLLEKPSIALVGSRLADEYGRKIAYELAKEISNNKICIVSGMAKGIDSMAHLGALRRSGSTIAVLGSGLDIIYPRENDVLYREIYRSGLLLSEFIVGTKPDSKNFPMRNRIVSGLSYGVIVVEAKEKSGALITVDFALEQGKNVYAVPGNIDNELSVGCNRLIRDGAKVVISASDVLEDFNFFE